MSGQLWVFIEKSEDNIKKVSLELMSKGRELAGAMGLELCAVTCDEAAAAELGEYGAAKVYALKCEQNAEAVSQLTAKAAAEYKPAAVMAGKTAFGSVMMSQLAEYLDTALLADVTGVEAEDGKLTFTRAIYAGRINTKIAAECDPVCVTVRPNLYPVAKAEAPAAAEVVAVEGDVDLLVKVQDLVMKISSRPELVEADVIVSGGRGLKSGENFKLLEDLADVFGGAVGGSRVAVDSGWIDQQYQVGQTGKTVSPNLYIACGISGAMQHIAGMGSSKYIIAINNDPDAPIFKIADYGIVGDLFEVVPMLTKELKKSLNPAAAAEEEVQSGKINKVAVIGAGNMGHQISMNAALNGFTVKVNDSFEAALERAENFANSYLEKQVAKEKMTQKEADAVRSRISFSSDLQATVADADLVIECVIENLEVKKELFKKIEGFAPKEAILATNSSTFPSSMIADVLEKKDRLCNIHYFNPAMVMKLVEIVKGPHTSDETIAAAVDFAKRIGKKTCVLQKEVESFVVNRFVTDIYNEALWLVDMGVASIEDIDNAVKYGLGHPMGPFTLMDLTGIDLFYNILMEKFRMNGTNPPSPTLIEKNATGEFGRKTGKGWYDYSDESK